MILIYTRPGLIVGLIGLALGLAVFAASGWLALGVLALAAAWIGLGVWWKYGGAPAGPPRRYPALYFVPLPILAALLVPLAIVVGIAEVVVSHLPIHPLAAQLRADERTLAATQLGGDAALSEAVAVALAAGSHDSFHVLTRVKPGAVLVLVRAPDLKHRDGLGRSRMLDAIEDALEEEPRTRGRRYYIGIQGKYTFGAIRVPAGREQTGTVVDSAPLRQFYGDSAAATAAIPAARKPPAPALAPEPGPVPALARRPEAEPAPEPPTDPAPAPPPRRPREVDPRPRDLGGGPLGVAPAADSVDRALADLARGGLHEGRRAIQTLAFARPDDRRSAEVVRAVLPAIGGDDPNVARDAIRALAEWGRPVEGIPPLIEALTDDRPEVRRAAIQALGKVRDPRVAEALASRLAAREDAIHAELALRGQGPDAEPALIRLLANRDPDVRVRACRVLMEVGGAATLRAFRTKAPDPEIRVRVAAQMAEGRIAGRVGAPAGKPSPRNRAR